MSTTWTVYRPNGSRHRFDQADLFAGVGTETDTQLLGLARRTVKPVLINLDGESAIAKPETDGDGALSFQALYDTCYTLADLERMQKAAVDTPDAVPPDLYETEIALGLSGHVSVYLAIEAENNAGVRARLREVLKNDPMFVQEFAEQIAEHIRDRVVNMAADDELELRFREATRIPDDIKAKLVLNKQTWRFYPESVL